jgi:uncharacterized RDD family membrane protein YckC
MNAIETTDIPASPVKRIAAITYDSFLLFGVLFAATLIPSLIFNTAAPATIENGDVVNELSPLLSGWIFQVYLLAISILFFCWFWLRNQQTLGMQAWRLRIESLSGQPLTIKQCLIRLFGAVVSIACLGAGYWWIWIDKENLSWHDRWSKTRIVETPKK